MSSAKAHCDLMTDIDRGDVFENLGLCGCFEQYKCGAFRLVVVHLIGLLAYGMEPQYTKVLL